jgi:hypothetical protein
MLEERRLATASKKDFDEIVSTKNREASKGKMRRAHDLCSSDSLNNFLEDCTIAPGKVVGT